MSTHLSQRERKSATKQLMCQRSNTCGCITLIRQLVYEAIEAERTRTAAAEAEVWSGCFGDSAPANQKARHDRIVRVASGQALLCFLRTPQMRTDR